MSSFIINWPESNSGFNSPGKPYSSYILQINCGVFMMTFLKTSGKIVCGKDRYKISI